VLAALYLFLGVLFPTTIIFGHEITGSLAQLINLFSFFVMLVMIYGFVSRKPWVWEYSIIWYILSMVSSFFALVVRASNIVKILSDSIIMTSIIVFIINGMVIWYIAVRKKFFKQKHPHIHDDHDRVFIHMMTLFFVILLLTSTLGLVGFYQRTSRSIDNNINMVRGNTIEEALFRCAQQEQPDRDLCFLTVVVAEPDEVDQDICKLIFSNFYKLTCFEALS
jgi:hypothetical protein